MKYSALIPALLLAACAAEEDQYTRTDADQALSEIPPEMRPAEMLDELADKLLVPDVARGGRALFTDIVTVESGEDVTFCTYLDYVTDEVLYLHDTLGVQSHSGHHAILQYLDTPQEPGTRPCPNNDDLGAQLGQVLGGTGGDSNNAVVLPANVVSAVPAGAQLVINHHWINTEEEAIEAQAEMITVPPESDEDLIIARAMAIVLTDFDVPAGDVGEASIECTFPEGAQLLSMLGHQHEWGTHVRADRMRDGEEIIFDHDYTPDMVQQPLTVDYALDEPFQFVAGDTVRMTCTWDNTTDAPLTFPREMCVLFGWQVGVDADTRCIDGTWF